MPIRFFKDLKLNTRSYSVSIQSQFYIFIQKIRETALTLKRNLHFEDKQYSILYKPKLTCSSKRKAIILASFENLLIKYSHEKQVLSEYFNSSRVGVDQIFLKKT